MFRSPEPRGFPRAVIIVFLLIIAGSATAAEVLTIGVVRDGPSLEERVLDLMRPELDHLLGVGNWTFKSAPAFDGAWDADGIPVALAAAMADPGVDVVVGVGRLVTQHAARPGVALAKPFISATVILGEAPVLPVSEDDHSTKPNFNAVLVPYGEDGTIRTFLEIAPLRRLHIGVDPVEAANIEGIRDELDRYARQLEVEILLFPVTAGSDTDFAGWDPEVDGFVMATAPRLTGAARTAYFTALTEAGILNFSLIGRNDLEKGAFATNVGDILRATARRVAGNIHQLTRGEEATDLPVYLLPDTRLWINGRTAAAIGFEAGVRARVGAEVLHPEALAADLTPLDMTETLALAEEGNSSLGAALARIEADMKTRDLTRSNLLPQVTAGGQYMTHNYKGIESLLADQLGTVNFTLNQMIYDDRWISDYRSAGRLQEASDFQRQAELLDVYTLAGKAYLDFVQGRIFYALEVDNLRLTETNLELAKVRVDVGQAGRDEVYRWEAELANRQGALVAAESNVEQLRVRLNQVLGQSQTKAWRPEEIAIELDRIPFSTGQLDSLILSGAMNYRRFYDAAVCYSLTHSVEMEYFRRTLEARSIQVGQSKRSYFLPKVGLNLSHDINVYTSGEEGGLSRDGTMLSVGAVLPLFEGTRRIHETGRQKALERSSQYELEQASEMVEMRTHNALRSLESTYPNLTFSRTAADKARLNFEVVREKYASGIVSITRLIEAQNSSFAANQAATAAAYDYLKDLVDLQRALGFFVETRTEEEIGIFIQEILTNMEQR